MSSNITHYIQKPEQLDKQSLLVLNELIQKYPFFQTARLLHIKNVQNINSQIDKNELSLTATYVSDRKTLYYLLHKIPAKLQTEDSKTDQYRQSTVEKDIKDSLKENISNTINEQLNFYEMAPSAEIELIPGLAIDIRKEYGEGIELDNQIYSINRSVKHSATNQEFFELTKQVEDSAEEEEKENNYDLKPSSGDLIEIDKNSPSDIEQENFKTNDVLKKASITTENTKDPESLSFTSWLDAIDNRLTINENPQQNKEPGNIDIEESNLADIKEKESNIELEVEETNEKNPQDSLIDKFIETNPRISPHAESINTEDFSKDSIKEHESFFTDTLAQIYIKQGHYAKAIFAYEKLSLKYPEKSTYFADQISEIKKHINNS